MALLVIILAFLKAMLSKLNEMNQNHSSLHREVEEKKRKGRVSPFLKGFPLSNVLNESKILKAIEKPFP